MTAKVARTLRHRPPRNVRLLLAALVVTGAGLLWLSQSSSLAATGRRIADLQAERSGLLERRTAALIAHARVTDPRAMAARADELGFGPAAHVAFLPVYTGAPLTQPLASVGSPSGPLSIVLGNTADTDGGASPDAYPGAAGGADRGLVRLFGMAMHAVSRAETGSGNGP